MRPISPTRRLLSAANARAIAVLPTGSALAIKTEDDRSIETEDGRELETEG